MTAVLGSGAFRYEAVPGWGALPAGMAFHECAAVATDSRDNVYVFSRGRHPVTVFSREGAYQGSWGAGLFTRAHGLHMAPDDTLWCTDDGDHTVRHCTCDGRVLRSFGLPGRPAPFMSGQPFNRCTHTALSPEGDVYVSDGYGNNAVHKFSPEGKHLFSWGRPGTGEGEFNLPHNIACDAAGYVYVADRENHRVQVFDGNGRFQAQWVNLHRACSLFLTGGACPCCYVGELGPALAVNINTPNIGPRISVLGLDGRLLARFGELGGGEGQFFSPHGLCVDSEGSIYVAEVVASAWPRYHGNQPMPEGTRAIQKYRRIPG